MEQVSIDGEAALPAHRLFWLKESPPSILPTGKGTWEPPGVVRATALQTAARAISLELLRVTGPVVAQPAGRMPPIAAVGDRRSEPSRRPIVGRFCRRQTRSDRLTVNRTSTLPPARPAALQPADHATYLLKEDFSNSGSTDRRPGLASSSMSGAVRSCALASNR